MPNSQYLFFQKFPSLTEEPLLSGRRAKKKEIVYYCFAGMKI